MVKSPNSKRTGKTLARNYFDFQFYFALLAVLSQFMTTLAVVFYHLPPPSKSFVRPYSYRCHRFATSSLRSTGCVYVYSHARTTSRLSGPAPRPTPTLKVIQPASEATSREPWRWAVGGGWLGTAGRTSTVPQCSCCSLAALSE